MAQQIIIQQELHQMQAAIVEAYNHSGGGGSTAAADVTYANASSGLTATNVQAAIDEIVTDLISGYPASLTYHQSHLDDFLPDFSRQIFQFW